MDACQLLDSVLWPAASQLCLPENELKNALKVNWHA